MKQEVRMDRMHGKKINLINFTLTLWTTNTT